MMILKYKKEIIRFFICISFVILMFFIISKIFIKDDKVNKEEIETSIINTNEDNSKIYVEYPRFKDDKINSIITDFIYSYTKKFKSDKTTDKALDITYDLYYTKNLVNVTFHIENTLDNIKNKNILINLDDKKIDYITSLYDGDYLKKEINDLVYYKYSSEIYDKVSSSSINNFTYILNDDKIDVYFNNITFKDIDYIPYINIIISEKASNNNSESKNDFKKYIAFTYDDGPSEYTKDLIKTLELNNSSATFFMLGNRMNVYSDALLEVYNSNSEVGSHSYAHKDLSKLTPLELKEDLDKTNAIFNKITNDNLKYLRPPYNYSNQDVLNSGYINVLWNIDPKDWLSKDSVKIYNSVIKNACDGCIVIMHDIYKESIEATKMLLPKLNEMGYEVVSISKLLEMKEYTPSLNEVITNIK